MSSALLMRSESDGKRRQGSPAFTDGIAKAVPLYGRQRNRVARSALGRLFGRSNLGEHRQEQNVISAFENAGEKQRPSECRQPQQIAGQERTGGSGQAAGNRGHARGSRTLRRRHDSHHVRSSGGDVHLRKRAASEQQAQGQRQTGHQRYKDEQYVRGQVREDHRPNQAIAPSDGSGGQIREARKDSGPKENTARGFKGEMEAIEQPQGEQRLHDESAAECIDAKERGKRVDPPSSFAKRRRGFVAGQLDRRRERAIEKTGDNSQSA